MKKHEKTLEEHEINAAFTQAAILDAESNTPVPTGVELDATFNGNHFKLDGDDNQTHINERASRLPDLQKPSTSIYTLKEAAIELRMSEKSVRRLIDRGRLRKCIDFGRVLIPRIDVDTFHKKYSAYSFA
jgi:excisionase family DNA binding protein